MTSNASGPQRAVDHRANAERLLALWAEDRDMDSEMQRWEFLSAANAHATLAMQGTQEQVLGLNERLLAALTAPLEPIEQASAVAETPANDERSSS